MVDFTQVIKVIIIDLLLSGDNAIVIAMATLKLNYRDRKKAIFLGMSGAIFLRVLFSCMATRLILIPFIQLGCGLILIWITIKLLLESFSKEARTTQVSSPTRLINAIKIIIIADFSMSMDNILAVAGASHGNTTLLIFGLLFSIPVLMFFSQKIARLMDNFPLLVYIGAIILSWVAGDIIFSDKFIEQYINEPMAFIFTIIITLGVLIISKAKIILIR